MARLRRPGLGAARLAGGLLALLVLLGSAGPASARDDDVEFALGLASRGYYDLAEKEIQRMLKGATPEKRQKAEYTRCELLRKAALTAAGDDRTDPAEVRKRFSEASEAFSQFLKAHPGTTYASSAEFNMANLMKDFAYYLTKNKDKFPDQKVIVEEAHNTFEEAIRYLTTIRDREHKADENKPVEDPGRFQQRNIAWYFLCVAMHDRAMLLPAGDAVRVQQLTQAIEETTRYLEETDGTIFGFFASMYLGLEYWHRAEQKEGWNSDDIKQAREWITVTVDAFEYPAETLAEWPALVNVIYSATLHYGRMCNQVGVLDGVNYPKLFVEKMEQIEAKLATVRSHSQGLQCLIEKGRAMGRIGMHEAAIRLLNQVSNWAVQADPSWGRAVDQVAKQALNDVIAGIPPDANLTLSPEILYKAGEGSLRDRNLGRAIRAYQRALQAVESEADEVRRRTMMNEYWTKCWIKINECYMRQERYREAFLAADYPVQQYLSRTVSTINEDEIDDLAYYRITALQYLAQKTKDETVRAAYKEAQEFFTEKFPGSDKGTSITYSVAVGKLTQANNLRSSGQTEEAQAAFQEAIDLLRKVPEKDAYHRTAQSRIGEAMVLMGKPEDAIRSLEGFIRKNLSFWNDPNVPPRQRQSWGVATFWIATAHDDLKRPDRVVETLKEFETRFKDASLDNFFPRVKFLRVLALDKAGRILDAEKEVQALQKDYPDNEWTPPACLDVANNLSTKADEVSATDAKQAEGMRNRAGDYYDFWIRRSSTRDPDSITFVGKFMRELGRAERAAELWTEARDIYQRSGNEVQAQTLTIYLATLLVAQGQYAEALPNLEELFIKTPGDVSGLRAVYQTLQVRPASLPMEEFKGKMKKVFEKILNEAVKDPAGAPLEAEARRAVSGAQVDSEALLRAFSNTPDARRALARATVFTLLGDDVNMPRQLLGDLLGLVTRSPDLMANLARCYDELGPQNASYPLRAINLYSTILDAAPPAETKPRPEGSRYSAQWFRWKHRWASVYLTVGLQYKVADSLATVCEILKSMQTLGELERADEEVPEFSRQFLELRDKADAGLRSLGKDGCK